MCERLLNLQKIYVSGQNICIEVYGNSVGAFTPIPEQSENGEIKNDIFIFGNQLNPNFPHSWEDITCNPEINGS